MTGRYNVLVIGGGGREHALVWKLRQSPLLGKIFCAPGNGGISAIAGTFSLPPGFAGLKKIVEEKDIDLIIVGPEQPLAEGITDYFEKEGVRIFGPGRKAAMLEGSKVFAKNFMKKYSVPTADFEVFDDRKKAEEYLKAKKDPVIKADGLCAGKGVILSGSFDEGSDALKKFMEDRIFGAAGERVVIEDRLKGEEASILVFVSGENYSFMVPSQDHKAVYEGDKGPNTGGMGAYAPTSLVNDSVMKRIEDRIMKPVLGGLASEGIGYSGVLYLGLMVESGDPRVLEFNVRFGDPETEVVLPMMKNDLLEAVLSLMNEEKAGLSWKGGACLDVVLASEGYPGEYKKGVKIDIRQDAIPEDVMIFHAGTVIKDGGIYTSGGRVLNVAATGDDIEDAREKVYGALAGINFEGMYYRGDIGWKELLRKKR